MNGKYEHTKKWRFWSFNMQYYFKVHLRLNLSRNLTYLSPIWVLFNKAISKIFGCSPQKFVVVHPRSKWPFAVAVHSVRVRVVVRLIIFGRSPPKFVAVCHKNSIGCLFKSWISNWVAVHSVRPSNTPAIVSDRDQDCKHIWFPTKLLFISGLFDSYLDWYCRHIRPPR